MVLWWGLKIYWFFLLLWIYKFHSTKLVSKFNENSEKIEVNCAIEYPRSPSNTTALPSTAENSLFLKDSNYSFKIKNESSQLPFNETSMFDLNNEDYYQLILLGVQRIKYETQQGNVKKLSRVAALGPKQLEVKF